MSKPTYAEKSATERLMEIYEEQRRIMEEEGKVGSTQVKDRSQQEEEALKAGKQSEK